MFRTVPWSQNSHVCQRRSESWILHHFVDACFIYLFIYFCFVFVLLFFLRGKRHKWESNSLPAGGTGTMWQHPQGGGIRKRMSHPWGIDQSHLEIQNAFLFSLAGVLERWQVRFVTATNPLASITIIIRVTEIWKRTRWEERIFSSLNVFVLFLQSKYSVRVVFHFHTVMKFLSMQWLNFPSHNYLTIPALFWFSWKVCSHQAAFTHASCQSWFPSTAEFNMGREGKESHWFLQQACRISSRKEQVKCVNSRIRCEQAFVSDHEGIVNVNERWCCCVVI